jgi:hypothetical protein
MFMAQKVKVECPHSFKINNKLILVTFLQLTLHGVGWFRHGFMASHLAAFVHFCFPTGTVENGQNIKTQIN